MSVDSSISTMRSEEIVALSKAHTLYEWSVQSHVDPIPIARAKGVYFWTPEGERYLDFNSQLMCVNVGHADDRIVHALHEQLQTLPYASPFMATEPRARLGRKLAEICPGDIDVFFFTNGGAESNENAVKLARFVTGRQKVLARYRSYHGATAGAMSLTGDPRRWMTEPGMPGVVHIMNPYHGIERGWEPVDQSLRYLEEVIQLEGPHTIAAFILEPVTGANGVLVPPDGYLQGVRALCDKYGILLIADEVMSGFGRTGEWFAINHWNVVPDLLTMAKGLTSAYVQLGAVGMRRSLADHFKDRVLFAGLTYNSHTLACAAALASIAVYEEDGLLDNARRLGVVMAQRLAELKARHRCVGDVRSLGLFGVLELVRNSVTREPLAPFNSSAPEMAALGKFFRAEGLYAFLRWNMVFTSPPLCIREAQLHEGFDIIDRGLEVIDRAVS